jgi:hypothetical protein
MKQGIIDFYAANNTPISKMIVVGSGRKGLSAESINSAAEQIYDEIKAGNDLRSIRLAWEVYSRAKRIMADTEKQAEIKRRPWWKRILGGKFNG